jgi:peptide/nickel transport system substrate-binding protein
MSRRSIVWIFTCAVLLCPLGPRISHAAAKPEGTIVIGLPSLGPEDWLVPARAQSGATAAVPVFNTLLERDDKTGVPAPGLAVKWEQSKDGKDWIFDLRKGVHFHEGWGELTADDVKFSYQVALRDDSTSDMKGVFTNFVKDVEVVNPYRVVFHMKAPNWEILYKFLETPPFFQIVSKKYFDKVGWQQAGKHPIGTGPYRFAEHKLGEYVRLEAVENYWGGVPRAKTLIIRGVSEEATRVAMLQTGALNLAPISYESIARVRGAGLKIIRFERMMHMVGTLQGQYLPDREGYDPKVPWALPDREKALKVRKALSLAINRQEIVDQVLQGMGSVEGSAQIQAFPGMPGYDPTLKVDPYDPAQAKKLLADAGYPDPSKITIIVDSTPHAARPVNGPVAQAMAMYWRNIGITVKEQTSDYTTLTERQIKRKLAGVMWVYPTPAFDEPIMQLYTITYSKGRVLHLGEYPELDAFMEKTVAELDPNRRSELQKEMGRWMYHNVIAIAVCYGDMIWGASPKFEWQHLPGAVTVGYIHNAEKMWLSK